jgi:hypothetical protein
MIVARTFTKVLVAVAILALAMNVGQMFAGCDDPNPMNCRPPAPCPPDCAQRAPVISLFPLADPQPTITEPEKDPSWKKAVRAVSGRVLMELLAQFGHLLHR